MFANVNNLQENACFSDVCLHLGKCSRKYFTLCVWSNVKQNKTKPIPKTTGNGNHDCQPTPQPTTNSTSHNNPPPTTTHRWASNTHNAQKKKKKKKKKTKTYKQTPPRAKPPHPSQPPRVHCDSQNKKPQNLKNSPMARSPLKNPKISSMARSPLRGWWQQNPLRGRWRRPTARAMTAKPTVRAMTATAPILHPFQHALIRARVPPCHSQPRAHRPHQPPRRV